MVKQYQVLSHFVLLDDDVGLWVVIVYVAIRDSDQCVTPNSLTF